MNMKFIYIHIILFCSLCLYACDQERYNSDNNIPEIPVPDLQSLKEAPYPIGAALGINNLKNKEEYRNTVLNEMTSITAENAMKMKFISLGRKQYNFEDGDYIVNFGQEHNLRVHGHTLIWSRSTPPDWIVNFEGDKEEWKALMKEYIQDVVGHFKGKVASWDVINEILNEDGTLFDCVWLRNIGPEYIELAFRYAHEADPDALLFYNDYGHEYSHARRYTVYHLTDSLARKGVPIHGIGLQMHTSINRSVNDLRYAIMAAGSTGLKIHVSELDVGVNPEKKADAVFTEELALKQQESYKAVAMAMSKLPEEQRFGITMWGVHDPSSWASTNPDWVLPFDSKYRKKPAYDGLLQGFYMLLQ